MMTLAMKIDADIRAHEALHHDVVRVEMMPEDWDDLVSELETEPIVDEAGRRRLWGYPVRLIDHVAAPSVVAV